MREPTSTAAPEPPEGNFNRHDRYVEGWYWAIKARDLPRGQARKLRVLGRDLVVFRTESGEPVIADAYCPHMGCHLHSGKVEGEGLRCFFHDWKFDKSGECVDVPSLGHPVKAKLRTWPTAEKYGMVWVYAGEQPRLPLPFDPEWEADDFEDYDVLFGNDFEKNCHPNVVMVNAADAHHFNTVHNFPVDIEFETGVTPEGAITFANTTRGGDDSWFVRLIRPLYKEAVTYKLCYWNGTSGIVTVGPDFFHFYILFTCRPDDEGRTEGRTIAVTRARPGLLGWLFNRVVLRVTKWVGDYFAVGDTVVFETIRFDLKTPVSADRSIVEFIRHVDGLPARSWGDWEPVGEGARRLEALPDEPALAV